MQEKLRKNISILKAICGQALCLTFLLTLYLASSALAQTGIHSRVLITTSIDQSNMVTLTGNTRPEATRKNDRGRVADDFLMDHVLLQLKRPPDVEKELQQFIDEQHNPASPNFHQWLTAQQFGESFGLAQQDLDTIARWLQSCGFKVNVVYPSGTLIDFSGTAAQVHKAFHTEIHNLDVNGVKHIANMSDPQVPAAIAPAVLGVVSLHDFRPHPMLRMRPDFTFGSLAGNIYAVIPGDLATIYNFNPLFNSGTSGQGQTVVVIEDTNVYSTADWNAFRSTFGLSGYTAGSFTQVHPAYPGGNNCTDPGVIANNDAEAILDAEYASAAAPSAAIELASCADTSTTFGGLIAFQNLINASNTPPSVMSISYGECEAANGATANAAYYFAYQQAAAEGVSVFVAAGDSGAAGCDDPNSASTAANGIGINAFASTPYNVAVGGTDFSDTYANTNSTYWNTTNSPTYGSAMSYVPEIPWNNSCASTLLSNYYGYSTAYGSNGFCNSVTGQFFFQSIVSGGGGPSGCATGAPNIAGVVGGTCQGWPKPSWQSVLGNPGDGVRDTPDISLFAANGLWNHYYIFCWSDTANGGAACTGDPSGWPGAGGTSFASPVMAGIQALVNQKAGGRQGNPNPVYYNLAAAEYGQNGSGSCNSSLGNAISSSCIFYDVTQGDIDVDCTGSNNCYTPSGSEGVLSTSTSNYHIAYGSTIGWDFASGIGTVNTYNLVNNWPHQAAVPGAPTNVSAVAGNAQATVSFTAPASNGGSAISSYTVTSNPGGIKAAGASSPIRVTGLTNGTSYTFTVTATNATGTGPASSPSNSVTPATVPGAPTNVSAVAGNAQATVSFTAPASNGGSAISSYTVTSNPGGIKAARASSPITVTGLKNGTSYTFTVSATNAIGTGPASAQSNSVTPTTGRHK
jgi:subtilase family serine protease